MPERVGGESIPLLGPTVGSGVAEGLSTPSMSQTSPTRVVRFLDECLGRVGDAGWQTRWEPRHLRVRVL